MNNSEIIPVNNYDPRVLALAKEMDTTAQVIDAAWACAAPDLNQAEFFIYLNFCKNRGLDPLGKEAWGLKMNGQAITTVSHDGYLKIATSHPDFAGMLSDVVYENDEFENGIDKPLHKYGKGDRGGIIGAYCYIYRKSFQYPVRFFAPFSNYDKKRGTWAQYPHAMIQKTAENMAIKRAFAISGAVFQEEIDGGDLGLPPMEIHHEPEPIDTEMVEQFERKKTIKRKNEVWRLYQAKYGDNDSAQQAIFSVIGPLPSKNWTRDDLDMLERALNDAEQEQNVATEVEVVEEKLDKSELEAGTAGETGAANTVETASEPESEKKARRTRKHEAAAD